MSVKSFSFLISIFVVIALFAVPALADKSKQPSCVDQTSLLVKEIGIEDAIMGFKVLHGTMQGDFATLRIVMELKQKHPDIDHQLESFVKSGCVLKDLEAYTKGK